ncbi:endospore germination permease [Metallumcola ferriviriculae]|uniref:Endospore germination permease n=1 Tax=Metallumcola ferriviriculae TaxID=3039180 RepID=A0AAU0UKN1_9FIRM|nr:endospore germination permease [Desulfitibacteraceae bacterium MK1]
MLPEKTGIGPGLMFMLLYTAILSFGLTDASHIEAKYIGHNGYLGILLAFILMLPIILIAVDLGKKFPDKSIIEYLPHIFGNAFGKILGFIFLLFLFAITAWSLKSVVDVSNIYFLQRTPDSVILFAVLLTSVYISLKGIETISRLAAFVFPLALIFTVLVIALSYKNVDLDQIRPVFYFDGFKLPMGSLHSANMFFPLALVFMTYQYLTEKTKGRQIIIWASALASLLMFSIVFGTLGVFGAEGTLRYHWSLIELTWQADIPFILQTFGMFLFIVWMTQLLITISALNYVIAQGLTELFSTLNYKWFILILFLPMFFLLTSVTGGPLVLQLFTYLRISGLAVIVLIPLVSWLLVRFLGRGEPTDA